MPDISKIKLKGITYDIKDTEARNGISNIDTITQARVDEITDYTPASFPSPVYAYETVADMQADKDLQEGMITHTNGFHASGDGGAAYYKVSSTGMVNGMDVLALQGGLKATLVVTEPYVTPEMFGAYGDGVSVDNIFLNKCFEVATDNDLIITGNGTYLVDDSTVTFGNRHGVLVPAPAHIVGMNFKLASGVATLTPILTCQCGTGDYIIEGCTFECDEYPSNTGTENGGNHAIIFIDENNQEPTDWITGFGNIVVKDCIFNKIWSYGIFPKSIDCVLTVDQCTFNDCHDIGIVAHVVSSFITNCKYKFSEIADRTVVKSFVHDEIDRFTQTITTQKKIKIVNCESNVSLYRIQQDKQYGLTYGPIFIDSCVSTNAGDDSFVVAYADTNKCCGFDSINVNNCLFDGQISARMIKTVRIKISNTKFARLQLGGVTDDDVQAYISNCQLGFTLLSAPVARLDFNECWFDGSSYYGCISSDGAPNPTTLINVNNCAYGANQRFMRFCSFTKAFITGLRRFDTTYPMLILEEKTGYAGGDLIITDFYSETSHSASAYTVNGATGTVIISGIAPNGIATISSDAALALVDTI